MTDFSLSGTAPATLGHWVLAGAEAFENAALVFGHGTATAFDEAAFIVLETLGLPPESLEMHWHRDLSPQEQESVSRMLSDRITLRVPASYLLGRAYLQGIPFSVDPRVIVPRSFIAEILCRPDGFSRIGAYEDVTAVLDVCTGSGCLAILAAHLFPDARIDAADCSAEALEVAADNVAKSGFAERLSLHQGDLFAPVAGRQYDVILANPPYVTADSMAALPPEYQKEPSVALFGGADGMDLVRRILAESPDYLHESGSLICEVGAGRDILDAEYPRLPFLWLDTEESTGEVFWIARKSLVCA